MKRLSTGAVVLANVALWAAILVAAYVIVNSGS